MHSPRLRRLSSAVRRRFVGLDVPIVVRCLASFVLWRRRRILPSRVPCVTVFAMVLCRVMWPNQESLHRFTVANKGSCFPAKEPTCCLTYSFVLCSVYEIRRSFLKHFVSNACTRLSVSAVRVQLSHL